MQITLLTFILIFIKPSKHFLAKYPIFRAHTYRLLFSPHQCVCLCNKGFLNKSFPQPTFNLFYTVLYKNVTLCMLKFNYYNQMYINTTHLNNFISVLQLASNIYNTKLYKLWIILPTIHTTSAYNIKFIFPYCYYYF